MNFQQSSSMVLHVKQCVCPEGQQSNNVNSIGWSALFFCLEDCQCNKNVVFWYKSYILHILNFVFVWSNWYDFWSTTKSPRLTYHLTIQLSLELDQQFNNEVTRSKVSQPQISEPTTGLQDWSNHPRLLFNARTKIYLTIVFHTKLQFRTK